jgi:tetratricopeptide (TPR) repeat protein
VWRNLGAAQRSLGDWDDAERTIERAREVDGDDAEYAAARALLLNARANVAYAEARYEEARDLYAAASELTPDDAVIHSNRANACARLWRPGHRLEDLADARAALARALELDPDETYQSRHDMLEFEARLLEAVGEPWWDDAAPPRVLAIELASDLLPLVLAPGTRDLSADTHALIERFRARVRERIGLPAPGISFAEDESQWPGFYVVYLLEQPEFLGRLPTDGLVFSGDVAELERLGIEGEPLELAWSDTIAQTLDGEAAGAAEAAGLELWHPLEVPLRHLEHAIAAKLARVEAD